KGEPPPRRLRIVWHGAQRALHSLALVNRELCVRLLQRGHELTLVEPAGREPESRAQPLPEELLPCLNRSLSGPADVHVAHQWPPYFTPSAEGHWVIMQPWEFGSLPRAWLDPMKNLVDEVWVPSNYVRNGFLHGDRLASKWVHVIPHGVASHFFERQEA